jgi:polysaccharide export outer membrane protein
VVTLIRTSLGKPVSIPLGPDPEKSPYGRIPLFPGDEIRVGKIGVIYAVGAFKTQGAYPLKSTSPTTVTQLVGLAGGIGYEAASGEAHIVRTTGDSKMLISLNVAKILKRQAPDVTLQSDDILFVPTNQMKAAIKGGGTGLIVSLASAYLYATK